LAALVLADPDLPPANLLVVATVERSQQRT
jgi:hypothetical protein